MPRYRTPDYLICLGGGGVKVGETYMNQRWILEEVLREDPREDETAPDQDERPLHAYFVDSDKTDLDQDIEENIEETVDTIEDENNLSNRPDVDGTVINIIEGPQQQFLTSDMVVAERMITDLKQDLNLDAWWLHEGSDSILDPLGGLLTGGVDRRRGLTKAISRINEWQADPLGEIVQDVQNDNNLDEPQVAVVVGIGGGTGSGLLLDLAYRLKDAGATLTLFGVLPRSDDSNSVFVNAYATLSELEYLTLAGLNLFECRILIPHDPAVDMNNFDKSVTYTINAFYNTSGSQSNTYSQLDETDKTNGPPKYAPFTIGTTRYLHYLKEDIDETRENFDDFVEEKTDALNAELDLYDALEEYIENHTAQAQELSTANGTSQKPLPPGTATSLKRRIDKIKQLLDEPFIQEFDFNSADDLRQSLRDIEDASQQRADWDDERNKDTAIARNLVGRVVDAIGEVSDYEPSNGWANGEEEFVRLVIRELRLIERRAGIVKAHTAIDDAADDKKTERVAQEIQFAIDPTDAGNVSEMRENLSPLNDDKSELKTEIDALDPLIEAGENLAEKFTDNWTHDSDIQTRTDEYHALSTTHDEILDLLEELQTKIEEEIKPLEAARQADNIIISGTDFEDEDYDRLNNLLDKAGCETLDDNAIEESVKNAKRARGVYLTALARDRSLKETLRSVIGQGTISGLQNDYRQYKIDVNGKNVLSLPEWGEEFNADSIVRSDIFETRKQILEDRETNLKIKIQNRTESILANAEAKRTTPTAFPEQKSFEDEEETQKILENHQSEFTTDGDPEDVTEPLEQEIGTNIDAQTPEQLRKELAENVNELMMSALVEPFTQLKQQKQSDLGDLEDTIETYEQLKAIRMNEGSRYKSDFDDVRGIDSIQAYPEEDTENPFRINLNTQTRGILNQTEDLGDTTFWSGSSDSNNRERGHLLENLVDITPEAEGEYLPINDTHISDPNTEQIKYSGLRYGSVFMSPLFEEFTDREDAAIEDISEQLIDNQQFTKREYYKLVGKGRFADAYDVSMTTFLGGVFLDNLTPFTDKCRNMYEQTTDINLERERGEDNHNHQDTIPNVIKHHTYGLDGDSYFADDTQTFLPEQSDGGFCYRRDLLNFNADGTQVLLNHEDGEEEEVAEILRQEYHEIVGYQSEINLQQTSSD